MKKELISKVIVMAAVLVLVGIMSAVFLRLAGQRDIQAQYAEQIDLGRRYLTEQKYEEAIVAFGKAIEIDPRKPEAYLELAEAYTAFDEYEKAAVVLEEGYKVTKDEKIAELRIKIKSRQQMEKPDESIFSGEPETAVTKEADAESLVEENIYKGILDQYWLAVSERWNRQLLSEEGLCYLCSYNEELSQIGYALMDIDGNGVKELLIGGVETGNDEKMFYDLYTIIDNEAVQIATSGERDRYYLCSNSKIANEGSGGAGASKNAYYDFDGARGAMSLIEAVIYDGEYDEDNPWFYSTEGFEREALIPIPEEKAFQIQSQYMYADIPFVSFENYSYSNDIGQRTKDIMTEAVTAIVYYYKRQETLAENFTDTDIQYFLEWHMNNEGYDNGTDNKPIFDVYEYGEYGRKWFDMEDVYKKMEDLYGREVNRELMGQDILFEFQDNQISMPGGDGDEWLISTLLECKKEDQDVVMRIHYRIEYNVPELNTEETVVATFRENPDSYIGYTLVGVKPVE